MIPTRQLRTEISLPPGIPSTDILREFLRLTLEEYRWFAPMRFGLAFLDKRIQPERIDYDALLAFYEERKNLCVAARTDRDFFLFFPSKESQYPHVGSITWQTPIRPASKATWYAQHLQQVAHLMRLVGSPYAYTALDEDVDRKTRRLIDRGSYQEEVITVRDYSEGLPGLFWRNFFGPPFLRLFGQSLHTLPPECLTHLGDDIALVQPYPLPTEAGSEAATAREQQLISLLGTDCFYDFQHHALPSRRPMLAPPP